LEAAGRNRVGSGPTAIAGRRGDFLKYLKRRGFLLYLFFLPVALYYAIFHYAPMYGVVIAFKDFSPFIGILKSPWVGFEHFITFFSSIYFFRLIRNTFLLSFYSILFGFPVPILLALILNELQSRRLRSIIQSLTYVPHFVSTVVVAGLLYTFLSPSVGFVNAILTALGGKEVDFLREPSWFRFLYVGSGIWQEMGWGSIIYVAGLASIDVQLYEAADMDGAGRLRKMWSISLPGILPIVVTMLLLNLGRLMTVGFEKVFLLYNSATYETSDVISTYVYRSGIMDQQYSFAAAVGLFNSVVTLVLLTGFNWISRRVSEYSLW
jgi:putative aldouronate transport system permease protein